MPDITMCKGDNCPKKERCYRYMAKPSSLQSYFAMLPVDDKGDCEHFWRTEPEEHTNNQQNKETI